LERHNSHKHEEKSQENIVDLDHIIIEEIHDDISYNFENWKFREAKTMLLDPKIEVGSSAIDTNVEICSDQSQTQSRGLQTRHIDVINEFSKEPESSNVTEIPSDLIKEYMNGNLQDIDVMENENNELQENIVPLILSKDESTITGNRNNFEMSFLVDTGAAISAVCSSFWETHLRQSGFELQDSNLKCINTVGGLPLKVIGKICLPLDIGLQLYYVNTHVIQDLTYEAILGRDFLSAHCDNLDFSNQVIRIRPGKPLLSEEESLNKDNSLSVHAMSNYILPPQSEIIVAGEINNSDKSTKIGLVTPRDTLPYN